MKRFSYSFRPEQNGGQDLIFSTSEGEFCCKITLCSYENTATFTLNEEMITPAKLRELADKLEEFKNL